MRSVKYNIPPFDSFEDFQQVAQAIVMLGDAAWLLVSQLNLSQEEKEELAAELVGNVLATIQTTIERRN